MDQRNVDKEVLKQVLSAVYTVFSEQASGSQRSAAQAYLDRFKSERRETILYYGVVMSVPECEALYRHTGMHLIEEAVERHWERLDTVQRTLVRDVCLRQIENSRASDPHYVREKAARMVVTVAKREWPQSWPQLMPRLQQLSSSGQADVTEAVAVVLRELSLGIRTYNRDLADRRVSQMTAALAQSAEDIVRFLRGLLETLYASHLQAADAVTIRRLHLVLSSLNAYVDWVELSLLRVIELPTVLCSLLAEPSYRLAAMETMLLLADRKASDAEDLQFLLFPFQYMHILAAALTDSHASGGEEGYLFHKRTAQELALVGALHLRTMEDVLPPGYAQFLDVMLAFAEHPSLAISSFVLPYWHQLVLRPSWLADALVRERLPRLVRVWHLRLVRLPLPASSNEATYAALFGAHGVRTAELLRVEVDDDARELHGLLDRVRSVVLSSLATVAAGGHLQALLEDASLRLSEILSSSSSSSSPMGMNSVKVRQLEALSRAFFCLLSGNKVRKATPDVAGVVERMVAALLTIDVQDASAVHRNALLPHVETALTALGPPLLKLAQSNHIADVLLARALHVASFEAVPPAARLRACASVPLLCAAAAPALVPKLAELTTAVHGLLGRPNADPRYAGILMEALAQVSNRIDEDAAQTAYLASTLAPFLEALAAPAMAAAWAHPASLAQFLGLTTTTGELGEGALARPRWLRFVLDAVGAMWRRVARRSDGRHPLADSIPLLLPPLLAFCDALHTLESQPLAYIQSSPLCRVLSVRPHSVLSASSAFSEDPVGSFPILREYDEQFSDFSTSTHPQSSTRGEKEDDLDEEDEEEEEEEEENLSEEMMELRFLVSSIRHRVYSTLGYMTRAQELYGVPDLAQRLAAARVLENVQLPPHSMSRLFALFHTPFYAAVPLERWPTLVEPTLPAVLGSLHACLADLWKRHLDRRNATSRALQTTGIGKAAKRRLRKLRAASSSPSSAPTAAASSNAGSSSSSVVAEMVEDALARELTRQLADWLRSSMVEPGRMELRPFGHLLLQSPGTRRAVSQAVVHLLLWPCSHGQHRALEVLPVAAAAVLHESHRKDAQWRDAQNLLTTGALHALLQSLARATAADGDAARGELTHAIGRLVHLPNAPTDSLLDMLAEHPLLDRSLVGSHRRLLADGATPKRLATSMNRLLAPLAESSLPVKSVLAVSDLEFLNRNDSTRSKKRSQNPPLDWGDLNPGIDLSMFFGESSQ